MNKGVERFFNGLEDSRLDSRLKRILDDCDADVMAEGYEKFLDKSLYNIASEAGISKNDIWKLSRPELEKLQENLLNKERSRKARAWNSKIDRISPSNEMESIISRIETEKRNLSKLLTTGPLNNLPIAELEVLPRILRANTKMSDWTEDYIFPEQDGFREYKE